MKREHVCACVVLLFLKTASWGWTQELEPLPAPQQWVLPSPLPSLQPPSEHSYEQGVTEATRSAQEGVVRLPPIEEIPLPPVRASGMSPFRAHEPAVRLVRGKEVMEISNTALKQAGLLEKAINSSRQLSQSYQVLEARTLQRQQMAFEVSKEEAKLRAQGANPAAVRADMNSPLNVLLGAQSQIDAAQALAEEAFERDLWNIGINGAKVAAVSTADEPDGQTGATHVLIQAMDDSPTNNLGYTVTTVYENGELGPTMVPSEYLLPLPEFSNDLFFNEVTPYGTQRAPDGVMLNLTATRESNPIVQLLAAPRFGLFHDTGFVASPNASLRITNFAERVALNSRRNPAAGQTFYVSDGSASDTVVFPVDIAAATQVMDVGGGQSLQFFTVANNDLDQEELDVESIGVRTYNRQLGSFFEGWSLSVGTFQSAFGQEGLKPAAFESNASLAGMIDTYHHKPRQVNVQIPLTDYLSWKIGLEEPRRADLFNPAAGITQLSRYPTAATNLVWEDRSRNRLLHLGGLVRSVGFQEAATPEEHFSTGWGLSAIAKFGQGNAVNFVGVAGGNGIGDYIQGVRFSAVGDATSIQTISGLGIYVGRQVVWYDHLCEPSAELNVAYGYTLTDVPAAVATVSNRKLHHGWLNYTRFLNDRVGVGFEYQYGYREDGLGDVGEDHRGLFIVAIRSARPPKSTTTDGTTFREIAAVTGAGGLDADLGPPALPLNSPEPAEATVDGRAVEEVIGQFQVGGPAHRQRL